MENFSIKINFNTMMYITGIIGAVLLGMSFALNPGAQAGISNSQLITFEKVHIVSILWGAWSQVIGTFFIVAFTFCIVYLAHSTNKLFGWLTFFGASLLMMVSITEVVFYFSALDSNPDIMAIISNNIAHTIQHLYFIIAAPALFIPLGGVIITSTVLPKIFGYFALLIGAIFFILGIISLPMLILPTWVTLFATIQTFWWVIASIVIRRTKSTATY